MDPTGVINEKKLQIFIAPKLVFVDLKPIKFM